MKKGFDKQKYSAIAVASAVVLMIAIVITSLAVTGNLKFPEPTTTTVPPTTQASTLNTAPTQKPTDDEVEVTFQKPERMQAVWLSAGVDYFISGNENFAEITSQIDTAIDAAAKYNMNTVIVPTVVKDKVIFAKSYKLKYILSDDTNDVFSYILRAAKEKGMFVYPIYNLQAGGFDPALESGMTDILNNVKLLVSSYEFSGILFDDYYFKKTDASYSAFEQTGGFDDYDTYKLHLTSSLINRAVTTAKKYGAGLYSGIVADAVYAKLVKNENGIESTGYAYEALIDGFCDTLSIVKKDMVNFVLVKNYCSLTDESARFDRVFKWWINAVLDAETDLYMGLSVTNVGDATKAGWAGTDQVVKQLKYMEGQDYNGVSFDSIKKMMEDKTGSTDVIIKYLSSTISANDLVFRDLSLTSPSQKTFTTYEDKFSLIGASDPNFPITLNGSTFERTEQGYFSLQCDLKPGVNKFVVSHKGIDTTITATYKVILIKEVKPDKDQALPGESQIMVTAIAKKGSKVTAKLGAMTVNMTESASDSDENANTEDSDFIRFVGTVILPKETSSVQDLGKISFTATLSGASETVYGGTFKINAAPPPTTTATTKVTTTSKPTTTKAPTSSADGSTASKPNTTQDIMDTNGTVTGGSKVIAQVITDQAELFKGNTVDDRSRPVYNYMPKGTLDYCGSSDIINYDDGALIYRKLNTGNSDGLGVRIYKKDIKLMTGTLPSTNSVTARSVEIKDRHTVITIDTLWKAPFYVEWLPQSYKNPNSSTSLNAYLVSDVTCKYIDITFAYAVSGQGKLDMTNNPLFKSAEWIKSGSNYKLRLHLKTEGKFYGFAANYNDYGQLEFKFLNPASIEKASNSYGYSLKGTVILLDAGHGGEDGGAVGSNKNYPEAKLNLMLAQEVEKELKALGATVVMTRSTDKTVSLAQRVEQTRAVLPDIFVSIHRNSAANSSATGYDSYYFYPFSKPLAQALYDKCTADGLFKKRSVNYYPFYVTRLTECPSVLTENGFVSNATELANLINSDFNKKQAKAITQGIVDYFKAQ